MPREFKELLKSKRKKPDYVVIKGLDIPFSNMVWTMVKFTFATVPAVAIIYIIPRLVGVLLGLLSSYLT